ncbi:MAG TPA: radical SAM protein [Verrucomicrobiae bacterium]|nr:radical SAM protein [Verrucomicrobiae bacterium]
MNTVEELTSKSAVATEPFDKKRRGGSLSHLPRETAFGCPRDFLDNRFVYVVLSPRARGLSVGVNLNPDRYCDFDCVYCEVNRTQPPRDTRLDTDVMAVELQRTLEFVASNQLRERPAYRNLPVELLELRHVALSGDGEPTLSPQFATAVREVVHIRALGKFPFFKLVLITNGSGLDRPEVQQGLKLLTRQDEIWIKLDGGTQAYINRVNRPRSVTLEQTLANIVLVGQQRPVVIQSLFPAINGEEPPAEEIEQFALRLRELKEKGAQISLVQIYSASRPIQNVGCSHLPLKSLSRIAQTVRLVSGLKAEVF